MEATSRQAPPDSSGVALATAVSVGGSGGDVVVGAGAGAVLVGGGAVGRGTSASVCVAGGEDAVAVKTGCAVGVALSLQLTTANSRMTNSHVLIEEGINRHLQSDLAVPSGTLRTLFHSCSVHSGTAGSNDLGFMLMGRLK
jgi:hypothetical protein